MASDLERMAMQFRLDLLRRERVAAIEMTQSYGAVYRRIQERVAELTKQITAARAAGEDVTTSWLLEQRRLERLLESVEGEIAQWARVLNNSITSSQMLATQAGAGEALQLAHAAIGSGMPIGALRWSYVPQEAFYDLVGTLQNGAPLMKLLEQLGPDAAQRVRETLLTGLATGQAPRAIATQIRRDCGVSLARALTISRTEVLRSYRSATLRSYAANGDVVKGWIWSAQLSSRTCAICWAMHGKRFEHGEPFASHPNCRCTPLPETVSWAELGFPNVEDTRTSIESGEARFARLPEGTQRQILGPGKYALYRDGMINLSSLVGESYSPVWGMGRYEKPLSVIAA